MPESSNYKEKRLEEQIQWHSKKTRQNKLRFRLCQIIILVASAIIPIINVAGIGDIETRLISSILGGTIVVITGLTQLEKYQENWILYRTSAELLKKEKYFYCQCIYLPIAVTSSFMSLKIGLLMEMLATWSQRLMVQKMELEMEL